MQALEVLVDRAVAGGCLFQGANQLGKRSGFLRRFLVADVLAQVPIDERRDVRQVEVKRGLAMPLTLA